MSYFSLPDRPGCIQIESSPQLNPGKCILFLSGNVVYYTNSFTLLARSICVGKFVASARKKNSLHQIKPPQGAGGTDGDERSGHGEGCHGGVREARGSCRRGGREDRGTRHPRQALRTSIKSQFLKILRTFGDECPQNGSKYGSMAPSTGLGCPPRMAFCGRAMQRKGASLSTQQLPAAETLFRKS